MKGFENLVKVGMWYVFLAPTGAQVVTLSVCPSVCLSGASLSRAVNLHLSRSESNQSTQKAIREHSESNKSNKIRVIQSEP